MMADLRASLSAAVMSSQEKLSLKRLDQLKMCRILDNLLSPEIKSLSKMTFYAVVLLKLGSREGNL